MLILCFCMQLFTIIINFCHFTFCRNLRRLEMCEICGTTPAMRVGVLETHESFNFNLRLSLFLYYLEVGDIGVMFKVYWILFILNFIYIVCNIGFRNATIATITTYWWRELWIFSPITYVAKHEWIS